MFINLPVSELKDLLRLMRDYGHTEMCILHSNNFQIIKDFEIEACEQYALILDKLNNLQLPNLVEDFAVESIVSLAKQRLYSPRE